MRLLNVRTLRFAEFITDIPRYAIASHRWTAYEATIDDLIYSRNTGTHGYKKIEQFCKATQNWDGDIQWLWIDTCCIDKKSSAELQEAITSMFRWYLNAEICFAYLADVSSSSAESHVDLAEFQDSEWFKRGWTLQELLAPGAVVFFSKEWIPFGHKGSFPDWPTQANLNAYISKTTAIPEIVLANYAASKTMTVEQRLDWALSRVTTRIEDKAYCLLGIFDISLPVIYGEGRRAFKRLKREFEEKQMSRESIESLRQLVSDPRSSSGTLRTTSTPATTPSSTPDFGRSMLPYGMQKRHGVAASEDQPSFVDQVLKSRAVPDSAMDSRGLVGYGDSSIAIVDFAARFKNDIPTVSLRNADPQDHPVSVKVKADPDGRHVTLRLTEEEAAAERAERRRARGSQKASSRASSADERSDKQGEHESGGHMLLGVPKISRWSKTTHSASKEDRPDQDSSEISRARWGLGPSTYGSVFQPPNDRRCSGHGPETQEYSDVARSGPLRDQGRTPSPSISQNLAKDGHQHNDNQGKDLERGNYGYQDSISMQHAQPPSQTSGSPSSFDTSSIFVQHEDQDDDGRTTAVSIHEEDKADASARPDLDVNIEEGQVGAKTQASTDHFSLQHPQPRAAFGPRGQKALASQVFTPIKVVDTKSSSFQRPISGFDPTIWGLSGVEELARFGLAQVSDIWSTGSVLTSAADRPQDDDVDEEGKSSISKIIEPAVALAVPTHHLVEDLPNEGDFTLLNTRGQDFDVLDDLPVESAELDAKSDAPTSTDSDGEQLRCKDVKTDHEKEEKTETPTDPETETAEAAVAGASPIPAKQVQTEEPSSDFTHVTSGASASAPAHASTASSTSFPLSFQRWETLGSHWKGMMSYWQHKLEQNSEEIHGNVPNAAGLTKQISDMSIAGENLFRAIVELQRLRASSERKFQRCFFETRADNERNMEIQTDLERQVQSERQSHEKAIRSEADAQATIQDANREIAELRRETWIKRAEARRAWAEINRRDNEAQQNLIQLKQGGVVKVGGVMVVSRASVTSATVSSPWTADAIPGTMADSLPQRAPVFENDAKGGVVLVPDFGAGYHKRQQKPQIPIRRKQIGRVEELDYGPIEIKSSTAPDNIRKVNGHRTEMATPGPEASRSRGENPSISLVERQAMPDASRERQNDQSFNKSRDQDQESSSKGPSQADGPSRRSASRERLTQKVMEKLGVVSAKPAGPRPQPKAPDIDRNLTRSNLEKLEASQRRSHPPTMRSRSELADIDDQSRVRRRRTQTTAPTSRMANNPKLLEMVEDTIQRMILPEINAIKEDQSKDRKLRIVEQSRHGSGAENESLERRQDRTTLRDITNETRASKTIPPFSRKSGLATDLTGNDPKSLDPKERRLTEVSNSRSSSRSGPETSNIRVDLSRPPLPQPTGLTKKVDRSYHTQTIDTSRKGAHDKSQTSLLIEYFEASETGDKSRDRPSVRVRVKPSASKKHKDREIDAVKTAGIGPSKSSYEADAEAKARERRRRDRKRRRAAQADAPGSDPKDVQIDQRSAQIEVSNSHRRDYYQRPDSPRPEDISRGVRQSPGQLLRLESITE